MKHTLTLLTALLLTPPAVLQAEPATNRSFDVRQFGAVADGKTLNTAAIQKAIEACHAAGGGRVVVAGGVFLSGAVQLKSGVTLVIEAGTTLLGSPDIRDYGVVTVPIDWGWTYKKTAIAFAPCVIYAENAEHVGLEGKGTVDGQGGRLRKVFPNRGDADMRRPILVRFHECHDVSVRDVTLVDPAAYATFFVHCRDIAVEGVAIRSRHTVNGDGLDFDGCRNVRITHCDLDCGDDAISPKTSHPDWPIENFTITGCRMKSEWAAIRLGAESAAPMRKLVLRDCVFTDCRDGVKIESSEGAVFENLSFSNIEMRDVNRPIYITATRFNFSAHARTSRPPNGRIRDVRFSDIRAVARAGDPTKPFDRTCAAIVSLPGSAIEDVTLTNVELTFPGGGTAEQAARLDVAEMLHFDDYKQWARPFDGELPASVLYLRHLRNIRLENVRLTLEKPDARPFIAGDDVIGLTLEHVTGTAPAPVPPLAKLADARGITTRDIAPAMIEPTADEQRRLAELHLRYAELEKGIEQATAAFDAASKAAICATLPAEWEFRPTADASWTKLRLDTTPKPLPNTDGAGWYAVTFETPMLQPRPRTFLWLGAVNGTCRAWLDDKLIGERTLDPNYVRKFPFAVDVTGRLPSRATHRLVVQVENSSAMPSLQLPVELRQEEAN
jgi:hypothetical protein